MNLLLRRRTQRATWAQRATWV